MQNAIAKNCWVRQEFCNGPEFDELRTAILSMPEYSQRIPSSAKEVCLPISSLIDFGIHFPGALFARHRSRIPLRHDRIRLPYQLEVEDVTAELLLQLEAILPEGANLTHVFNVSFFGSPSPELGVLQFKLSFVVGQPSEFSCRKYYGFPSSGDAAYGSSRRLEYEEALKAKLEKTFASDRFPGVELTRDADLRTRTGAAADVATCWKSLWAIPWIAKKLARRVVDVELVLKLSEDESQIERDLAMLAGIGECYARHGISPASSFYSEWSGFDVVDPDWLSMGSLTSRLSVSEGGSISSMPLGCFESKGAKTSKAPLFLYTSKVGAMLVVKGGDEKLIDRLRQTIGGTWLKGVLPGSLSNKVEIWQGIESVTPRRPPPAYTKVPSFFSDAHSGGMTQGVSKPMMKLHALSYFEGFPEVSAKQAFQDLAETSTSAKDEGKDSVREVVRWTEPSDWTQPLRGILKELAEVSYGLFEPENIRVQFEDDLDDGAWPPEPGSEVRISFDFGGKRHEVVGEFFHGAVPYELMPFVQKVMEEHCNGVAFRPIFGEGPEFALCTSGALDRLKKAFGLVE